MIKELLKLANHLDNKGFKKEADYLDNIIRKKAEEPEGSTPEQEVQEPVAQDTIEYYIHQQFVPPDPNNPNAGKQWYAKINAKDWYTWNGQWDEICISGKENQEMGCNEIMLNEANFQLIEGDLPYNISQWERMTEKAAETQEPAEASSPASEPQYSFEQKGPFGRD